MATATEHKTVEGFLVESFKGIKDGKPLPDERLNETLNELDDALLEQRFDINGIDYNEVIEKLMPDALYRVFERDRPSMRSEDRAAMIKQAEPLVESTRFGMIWDRLLTRHMRNFRPDGGMMSESRALSVLQEEGVVPISATQMDRFRPRCETRVMQDFSCPPAPTAFSNIFSRIDMPCSDFQDNKFCEFPLDPPPDLCCNDSNDDDPAEFYGLGPERCWKLPKPCYMHFAFGMHRNLVCVNADALVRQQIEARIRWFDIIDEWKRTRLLFNAFSTTDCDSYPFHYDGIMYPSGWQDAAAGAPWTNVIQDPALAWTACTEGPMCVIEQVFEDMRDPLSEFPVDCGGNYQVILTRDCAKYSFWEVLGARMFRRTLTDGLCSATADGARMPREGWSREFIYSRYAWDILVDFYLNDYEYSPGDTLGTAAIAPALAQSTAELWAANTYVVSKGLAQTFGTLVDFDISTRTYEGTNTWMYFDRGIRWARRYERKQTDGWLRPWLTILVRAFDPLLDSAGDALPIVP